MERYKVYTFKNNQEYVFDKYVFRGIFVCFFILFILLLLLYGKNDKVYLHCDYNVSCDNPVYKDQRVLNLGIPQEYIDLEYLPPFFELNKPPKLLNYTPEMMFFIVFAGLIYNHYKNNKGFNWKKFKEENLNLEGESGEN